jgi:hypothetical protein
MPSTANRTVVVSGGEEPADLLDWKVSFMWMSNILILVNRDNADRNGLLDISAAVADAGANVIHVDEERFAIEAAAPTGAVATISAMEGVSYVRCVFSYVCDVPSRAA